MTTQQIIILIAAGYFALVGLASLVYQLRIRTWPMTRGELAGAGISRWGRNIRPDEQDYKVRVRYTYFVDSTRFEGHRLSPWFVLASANLRFLLNWQLSGVTRLEEDDAVAVYYSPANPQKSFLIQPGMVGLIVTGLIVVVSLLTLALVLRNVY